MGTSKKKKKTGEKWGEAERQASMEVDTTRLMSTRGGTEENGWATVVDLRRPTEARTLRDGGVLDGDALRGLLKEGGGLVIVENIFEEGEGSTVRNVCTWMEETMSQLGSRMSDFSGTPVDPEADGDHEDFVPAIVPGHPCIRLLGNTSSPQGRPSALICHLGYQWHQDGTTDVTQQQSSGPELLDRSRIYTMLLCRETPERGAETLFCRTKDLYNNLNDDQRAFLASDAGVAVYSNEGTAGGPAAIDASFGLRMNPTGTRRIRSALRRRKGWKPNVTRRKLVGVDAETGEGLFWPAAKNFEGFVGVPCKKESDDMLEKVWVSISISIETLYCRRCVSSCRAWGVCFRALCIVALLVVVVRGD